MNTQPTSNTSTSDLFDAQSLFASQLKSQHREFLEQFLIPSTPGSIQKVPVTIETSLDHTRDYSSFKKFEKTTNQNQDPIIQPLSSFVDASTSTPVYQNSNKVRENVHIDQTSIITVPTSKSMHIHWKTTPNTIFILNKINDEEAIRHLNNLVSFLVVQKKVHIIVEPHVLLEIDANILKTNMVQTFLQNQIPSLHSLIDLVITIGGDGTLLHANSLFQGPVPPTLSFCHGSLSFLASFHISNYPTFLNQTLVPKPHFDVICRTRVYTRILRGNSHISEDIPPISVKSTGFDAVEKPGSISHPSHPSSFENDNLSTIVEYHALNEVVIDRADNPHLTNLECYADGTLVAIVQADGIIIASSTGSTAYNLSAGGSILHPQLNALLFTPICPHSLSFRPLILPESIDLTIKIAEDSRADYARVTFDGRFSTKIFKGDLVSIITSKYPFPTFSASGIQYDWFSSLNSSLNWNQRSIQKPLFTNNN